MNTLRISPSAYIDGLTIPELNAELVLAASRLVGTRVVPSGLTDEFLVCRDCACRGRDRNAILHAETCITGWAAHVLLAIAHAEANLISPTHRKEPSQQENSQSREPSRAAAQEKRPFVLQAMIPMVCEYCGQAMNRAPYSCRANIAGMHSWVSSAGEPWTGDDYGEPWTSSADGEVLDREGQLVVDPYGSGLVEPDDVRASHRIVACVNHCTGVPTEALVAETARATAGGGR